MLTTTLLVAIAGAAEPPPKIDAALDTRASRPLDAAVVIGNETYAYLPTVDFAGRDSQTFYDTLLKTRGLAPENISHLEGANRDQILDAVQRASQQALEDGTVWVYFAGHGAASPSSGELMLVGDDAKQDPEVFTERSITVSEIAGAVSQDLVLVLDTCYAGFGRTGEQLIPGTRFAVPAYDKLAEAPAVTLWSAAGPDEISGPYGAARHGLFTYFVAGAMRGWADGELGGGADGEVSLGEAQAYLSRAFSTLQVTAQSPVLTTSEESLVLTSGRNLEDGPALEGLVRPARVELPDAVGAGSAIPPIAQDFAWPITHLKGSTFEDAYNVELSLRRHLMPIAEYDQDGRKAVDAYTATPHLVIASLGVVGAYSAYFFGWDLTVGHTMHPALSGSGTAAGVTLLGSMLVWETLSQLRKPSQRAEILDAANRVVTGEAR
jgi:hypothetical protein